MLLDRCDVRVKGGDLQLHDYVICRVEFRSVDATPTLRSTVYCLVSLGDIGGNPVQVSTNGFSLAQIGGLQELLMEWRKAHAEGRYEQGFLDFLLRRIAKFVDLEFLVEDGRMGGLSIHIGPEIRLRGRFPLDEDVLSKYFGAVLAQTD